MGDEQKINREDCLQVLEKCLNCKDFHLSSFEVSSFGKPFQGMIGEHYTLRVKYEYNGKEQDEEFFVKTLSTNPLLLTFSKNVLVYEKETFFYNLLEDFEKYNIDTSFAPRAYFFKPHTMVLQDLSKLNYKSLPKKIMLDFEHCRVGVETIAQFHAATITYERRKSKELGKTFSLQEENTNLLEDKFQGKDDSMASRWIQTSIKGLFQLIDLIPENHVSHEDFKAKFYELLTDETPLNGVLSTILHGDLWSSNFLFLYKDGKPVGGKLLDYQLINYGFVEQDLVKFLMTNTTKEFREVHFEEMIEHYFEKLQQLLSEIGLKNILPEEKEFLSSCENFKLPSKVSAIIDHSFTFVDDDVVAETMQTEESFRNYLFEERGKYVEESYRKNKEFKERLTEDAIELRDLLFS